MKKKSWALIALIIGFISCSSNKESADLVLFNGNIITIANSGDRAEALAIKNGKIMAIGKSDKIKEYISTGTQTIDLQGKTVVPGFNDAHLHPFPQYPFESPHTRLDLGPAEVKDMQELIALLKRKADLTPDGIPINGFGYQDTKLGGHPTRKQLDMASTRHPILIRHSSGHIVAVNSFVLETAGINKNTKDPSGGSFDREKDGMPNGVCRETALTSFMNSGKLQKPIPPTAEEEEEGYKKCFDNFLSKGITSITEAGSSFEKMAIYKTLQTHSLLPRINLLISEKYVDSVISKGIKRGYGDERLRISGIKVFHGNSLSGRTCWLKEPYDMINPLTGKKDYFGISPKRSQAELDSLFFKIHSHGLQIACHSNGDREIEMVLNSFERIHKEFPVFNSRHRIEHCSVTNDSILQRVKNDSIVIVLHSYIFEHGDKMIVYGSERQKMMFPNKTALEMGIAVAQHSDYPISAAFPMVRIQSLATRTSAEGIVIGENQKISAEEAIKLWTLGGAYASFEEKSKGTLEPGKWADLVVLDQDPTNTNPFKIKDIKVLQTFIAGEIAYNQLHK